MTIRRRKLTKKVWYDDVQWDVVKVLRPTRHDEYLLLKRKNEKAVHVDGGNTPIDMVLLDVGNDIFYPDTPRVRKAMALKAEQEVQGKKLKNELENEWLAVVLDDSY